MATLLPPPLGFLSSPPSSLAFFPNLSTRLRSNSGVLNLKCSYGICSPVPKLGAIVARAAGDDAIEQTPEDGIEEGESKEGEKKSKSVQNLPLESKLQMIAEQRMKMKLAKKIRLRRKRLLRKRKMRKKERWPPSKMKKLKNV